MKNRQFSTLKLTSGYIKQFKNKVELDYSNAKKFGKIINLADSQMLRTIRGVTDHKVDYELLESWYKERDSLKKLPKSKPNSRKIYEIQEKINDMMFIPEYITVVMDSEKQYETLFKQGFYVVFNGVCRHYKRLSCSAGQARVSTVVFCDSEILDEVRDRLDNGRDKSFPISPSKFNAYFGLYSSASKVVSTPRFCVVPDYESNCKVRVNYVTETSEDEDDIIDMREIEIPFNRTDGMGLITYEQAKKWAEELVLDYVPAEWCIRQSFTKGMLATFSILEFCDKIGQGRYETTDVYGNKVDLREIDVILTESQFKLWNAYPNLEYYNECCEANNLKWGIAIHTPKKDNDVLKLNYQFLQTLNLDEAKVDEVCSMFIDWIKGVSFENLDYLKLFLLGGSHSEKSIQNYLRSSDNYWVKALLLEPRLLEDKFIRKKIYDLIKTRIKEGCLGSIIVNGNFQVIVSDPYAMMQHVLGMEVTGLLKEKEFYANYWTSKGVNVVDSMRAPMTYLSEHVVLNLRNDEEANYWYRYLTTGVILNYFGHETMNYAGSDFDFDIMATTDNSVFIENIYKNELPVYYEPPKPKKVIPTEKDLYEADTFSFGTLIGQITNKGSAGYAILDLFDEDSQEYQITKNRLKMSCKLQSAQIDKSKIGQKVKGIPKIWVSRNEEDEINNKILLDRHPYFFIYLYKETKKKYDKHMEEYISSCRVKFKMNLDTLIELEDKNEEHLRFLSNFYKYSPVIESNSAMNMICKKIEQLDKDVKLEMYRKSSDDLFDLYFNSEITWSDLLYDRVKRAFIDFNKQISDPNIFLDKLDYETSENPIDPSEILDEFMSGICSNAFETTNYLLYYVYKDKASEKNKKILWATYGKYIFGNIKSNLKAKTIDFPIKNSEGDILYLGQRYRKETINV